MFSKIHKAVYLVKLFKQSNLRTVQKTSCPELLTSKSTAQSTSSLSVVLFKSFANLRYLPITYLFYWCCFLHAKEDLMPSVGYILVTLWLTVHLGHPTRVEQYQC